MESKCIFDIVTTGIGYGLDEGSKGEKDTKDESQSFGLSKWDAGIPCTEEGVLKEENCGAGLQWD